jgi:hypothetical protein
MKNFLHFIQYHNAVPIALGIVILGSGITFAATDPQAIYSAQQTTVAVDNTYLVDKDLSTYTPVAQISGVTEDGDNYYVAYNFSTIDLDDGVWKNVVKPEVLTVSKADLGPYRDLGVYVTQQLKQNIDRELQRLRDTQDIEKQQVSQKVVATTYGGLVGKFLNDTTETLPGYTPVVTGPPPAPDEVATAAAAGGTSSGGASGGQYAVVANSSGNPSLRLQLLGNNPAQVPLRSAYVDLGAVVSDAGNDNIGIHVFIGGAEVPQVQIDTSTTSVVVITYRAQDPQGNSVSATRTVYVYDPAVGPPVPDSQVQNAGNAPPPPPPQQQTTTTSQPASTTPSISNAASAASATSSPNTAPAPSAPPAATTTPTDTATTTITATSDTSATSTPATPSAPSTPPVPATTGTTDASSTTTSATSTGQ